MRNADLGRTVIFTGWLITLFLAGVLAGEFVLGAEVQALVRFTGVINVMADNNSVTVTVPGGVSTFGLTNATAVYSVPFSFADNLSLFNVTADLKENQACLTFINETVSNQTAYLEALVRGQLVPSQQQYSDLQLASFNASVLCDAEKNILRNEIIDWRVQINATRTSYESVVQRQGAEIAKLQGEKRIYYFLNLVLLVVTVVMLVGFAKNITPRTMWDWFANMRGPRPSVGFQKEEVKK